MLLLVDIGVNGVDADDVALGVAIGRVVDAFPALFTVGLLQQFFRRYFLAVQHAVEQRLQLKEALFADDLGHSASGEIAPTCAEPFFIVAIEESIAIFAIDV